MKVYYSDLCPDCTEAKKVLDENDISFDLVEITESMAALKEFLKLRDEREEFEEIKEENKIGIPCFYFEDSSISFDVDEAVKKEGI